MRPPTACRRPGNLTPWERKTNPRAARTTRRDEGAAIRVGWRQPWKTSRPEDGRPATRSLARPRARRRSCAAASFSLDGARRGGGARRARPRSSATSTAPSRPSSTIRSRPSCPTAFRAALAALAPRLGLLAFVTGRDVRQARAMVGVDGAAYVGLHGFDRLAARRHGRARPRGGALRRGGAAHGPPRAPRLDAGRLGLVVENKGPMLDLHYRKAADPAATLAVLETEILAPARDLGLRGGDGPLPGRAAPARAGRQGHGRRAPPRDRRRARLRPAAHRRVPGRRPDRLPRLSGRARAGPRRDGPQPPSPSPP